jgi:hypothetical protein
MAHVYTAYPTPAQAAQLKPSTEAFVDDLVTDRMVNGTVKARVLFPAPKKRFELVHRMTLSQYADYRDFYLDYRGLFFTFTWALDGATYTCCFEAPPKFAPDAAYVNVTVALLQQ